MMTMKKLILELAINRGKEEGIPRKDIEDVLEEYDMSIDYLENPDEENNIEYTHDESDENDELESLDEVEDEFDDEEIEDSIWYKGDEEDEDIESVIGLEETEKLRKRLEKRVGWKSIPVWHMNRGYDKWIEICKEYDYVCFGAFLTDGLKESKFYMIEQFLNDAKNIIARFMD